jgi:uncharacterized protein YoxC
MSFNYAIETLREQTKLIGVIVETLDNLQNQINLLNQENKKLKFKIDKLEDDLYG